MFEIDGLQFKTILNIEHLTLNEPITCIVGASGSGKTTLLRHLNRLAVPDAGIIRYKGENLAEMEPVTLRRRVVMLGQTPVLYDGTVADNLQIGRTFSQKPPADQGALCRMLERMELPQSPEDYCDKLSGGEKQRLCLARVLLMDAETYLLDEPSSALDRETELFIVKNLANFVQERHKQLIIVTHSEAIAALYPQSCIRLVHGRVGGDTQ